MSFEVGYRKPPISGQFRKGTSGNPKGRPKGSKSFVTLLEQELAQTIVVTENGKKKSVTRLQAMVKRLVAGALQGDQKALLTMIEVLRRAGDFEPAAETQDLLPENYKQLLDDYINAKRQSSARPAAAATTKGRKP